MNSWVGALEVYVPRVWDTFENVDKNTINIGSLIYLTHIIGHFPTEATLSGRT
jgi:hypothetical protein